MASPVKNLLLPTSPYYFSFSRVPNNTHLIIFANRSMYITPMFNNQLQNKFLPILATVSKSTSFVPVGKTALISRNVRLVAVNTFPSVYQAVNLRPSVGQLFPLTGSIPY